MSFGVVATGRCLGERVDFAAAAPAYLPDVRAVRGWGYLAFHRAAPDVGLVDLAVAAAREALAAADLPASELDLVVLAVPDIAEYLYWDPAAAAQGRLGARHAEAVLVNQACGGGVTAFDTVAGRFATHPDHRTAVVIGANRVCERYVNRMAVNTSVNGDGAAAAVVRRDHGRWRHLVTETATDGRHADLFRLTGGGTAAPFDGERIPDTYTRLVAHFGDDRAAMVGFAELTLDRMREVVVRAVERAGVAGPARLVHLHDNQPAVRDLAATLGVPLEHTNADLAAAHGHLGCADQVLGLGSLMAAGEPAPGEVVALTAAGSGMHWACTLFEA